MTYTIQICPVCGKQATFDDDEGWVCYHHDYSPMRPIEVEVEAPKGLEGRLALERFRLAQEQREWQFQRVETKMRQAYLATLSDEELKEELGPIGMALHQIMLSPQPSILRQLWQPTQTIPHR